MSDHLIVRLMRREDVPEVCAVDRLCFSMPWSDTAFTAEMTNTAGYYLVADLDGRIVGYIGTHMVMDEAHITTLGVHPDVRRRGIAERLLGSILNRALESGCRRMTLEVRESNRAAQGLYRKFGFSCVSRRRRYYADDDEDAVVMWIDDMARPGFLELLQEMRADPEP